MKPYYLKFKKENEEWINKGAGYPCPDFYKKPINPITIRTDTFSLINYETGIYRLKCSAETNLQTNQNFSKGLIW